MITLICLDPEIRDYSIRILSSSLKSAGHDTQIIFLPQRFDEAYKDEILDQVVRIAKDSNLIGISFMTNFFFNAVQIIKKLKILDMPIVCGGIHPTVRPEECLKHADIVCIGEGERTIVELASRIKEKRSLKDLKGIWYNHGDKIIKNKMRELIQDLDSLPFPDYDIDSHYVLDENKIKRMTRLLLMKHIYRYYSTVSTRGCPFGCTYCCNNIYNKMYAGQKIVRKRSISNLIKELTQIKNKYPEIQTIQIIDDSFFIYTKEEIKEFSEKYKSKINVGLYVPGISPATFDEDKFSYLVDAGLMETRMGIQTASENVKKIYHRNYSNELVLKAAKGITKFRDKLKMIRYDIILDNPFESEEDSIETLKFMSKLPTPCLFTFFSLTFYPGTQLYNLAKEKGFIKDDIKDVYLKYDKGSKRTYINRLFFLFNDYTRMGGHISKKMISLLTNKKLRKLRINWIIYGLLKVYAIKFKITRLTILFREGMKDILKGDFLRIKSYATDVIDRIKNKVSKNHLIN
ncbi:MAG: radical SAM protein [Nanoarchaeota archaeon]|nr:radical SAM protein [Nanoarchaeota archaeon]